MTVSVCEDHYHSEVILVLSPVSYTVLRLSSSDEVSCSLALLVLGFLASGVAATVPLSPRLFEVLLASWARYVHLF